jgi:RNA polymerase sigma factor (sigma-70 family)
VTGAIRLLFEVGTVAGMSDGQLLDRFLARRSDEEAAEVAFAALVERHGPMVLRACRARLGDEHDAQDAFQATFLILARKAGLIRNHESAASWLHGVARRVASCARRAASVRRAKERKAAGGKLEIVADADRSEVIPAVREEVGDLPEKYRAPLMLCLLDGLTHEEAATRLGWPVGTVKTRVRRAKDQLRVALTRRGLAPSIGAIGAALATREASAMPANLVRATARAALGFEVGRSTALISASVARLVELGMGSLIMTRLKLMGLIITTVGVLVAGAATGVARQGSGTQEQSKPAEVVKEVKDVAAPKPAAPINEIKDEEVTTPVAVEVAKEAVLDQVVEGMKEEARNQLEMARLQLDIRRAKIDTFKDMIIKNMNWIENQESRLKDVRSAKNLEELRKFGASRAGIDFELAKKEWEDWLIEPLNRWKGDLKRTVTQYSEMKRELALEEKRLKELEALAEPPGPSEAAGGDNPIDDDRLARIEAAKLDIELLEIEVAGLKRNVTTALQVCLNAKSQMGWMKTQIIHEGGPPEPLKGQALEDAKKKIQENLDYNQHQLEEARAAYLSKNRDLKREQRRLKDLEAQAGAPETRAVRVEPSPESKKPADIEARLSDVERKLDLILKALKK